MKHKLSLKFFLGYLLFGIVGFFVIAFVSSSLTYRYLVESHSRQLYDEANYLAYFYRDSYQNSASFDEKGLADRADAVSAYFDCHVWVIRVGGEVLFDNGTGSTGKASKMKMQASILRMESPPWIFV